MTTVSIGIRATQHMVSRMGEIVISNQNSSSILPYDYGNSSLIAGVSEFQISPLLVPSRSLGSISCPLHYRDYIKLRGSRESLRHLKCHNMDIINFK
ncbi:unnamed protein product [Hymenolepis diminuta]|uniref:Uncharacterized protein n=1 Tax=Hymenolepis diminuta TaxID=6216 RepID=A0A564YH82_HYMDI|nr:unnamed protein product [Hymenolepis diminuta]